MIPGNPGNDRHGAAVAGAWSPRIVRVTQKSSKILYASQFNALPRRPRKDSSRFAPIETPFARSEKTPPESLV
jgi:hypothetical protein